MRRLLLGSAALCCLAGSRDARVTRHVRPGGADATVDPWPGRAAIPSPSPGGAPCRWVNVTYPGVREFRQCVRPAGAGDLISDVVARDGRWRECDALVPLWRETADEPAGLFVDVGANIGACALPLLRLGARTLAFEPLRVNLAYLTRSVLANVALAHEDLAHRRERARPRGRGDERAGVRHGLLRSALAQRLGRGPRLVVGVEGVELLVVLVDPGRVAGRRFLRFRLRRPAAEEPGPAAARGRRGLGSHHGRAAPAATRRLRACCPMPVRGDHRRRVLQ